jgi:hypothetical protein
MSKTTDGQSICHKAGSGTKTQPQRYGNSERKSRRKENTSRERTLKKGSKMVKRKRRDNKHQKFYEHMTWTQ